jgi:transposase
MRKIQEVLRLKWAGGLSNRTIARSCSISHSTVKEYLRRAELAGLSWPLPEQLTEDELFKQLFPERLQAEAKPKAMPDWQQVHAELRKQNVTLKLLWTEYKATPMASSTASTANGIANGPPSSTRPCV